MTLQEQVIDIALYIIDVLRQDDVVNSLPSGPESPVVILGSLLYAAGIAQGLTSNTTDEQALAEILGGAKALCPMGIKEGRAIRRSEANA